MASKTALAIKEEEARQADKAWRESVIAELARLTAVVAELKAAVAPQVDAPKRGK